MGLFFQTLRSGSSGNVLMVWSRTTRVMIDCGATSQRELRAILGDHGEPPLAAVVNSHPHTDHINYHALRVLEAEGVPLYVHRDNRRDVLTKHSKGRQFHSLNLLEYDDGPLEIGDLVLHNFETAHEDGSRNCGFAVEWAEQPEERVVIATDFYDWERLDGHFVDAGVIYVEANHCPELLRRYPNWNSHFHLSNPKTGYLLSNAWRKSLRRPTAVVLGHLSSERNRPDVALETIRRVLRESGVKEDVPLEVAPRYKASAVYRTRTVNADAARPVAAESKTASGGMAIPGGTVQLEFFPEQ